MRVLFPLHLFYPSKIGGPANTVYWLGKALAKNGHDVTVVSTRMGIEDGRVELDKWTDVDGIRTRYCRSESIFPVSVIINSINELRSVDTVIFSSICFIPNLIIGLFAKFKGKRIVWSPRGELFDSAIQNNRGKKFFFYLIKVLFGQSITFHATSDTEKKAILRYFPHSEVVVIPNYLELPQQEEVAPDYHYLIYVGRIAPIKAIDRLIDGLNESALFRASKYRFMLVGGVEEQFQDYYSSLKEKLKKLDLIDKVVFAGSLSGKEKNKAFAQARYSFLVSYSENFGNVVIEALSQGTPVVASKGTPWESLSLAKAGFWIENTPKDIGLIVDNIIEQADEEYYEYRKHALALSKSFDVYEHVDEWERVLSSSINKQ